VLRQGLGDEHPGGEDFLVTPRARPLARRTTFPRSPAAAPRWAHEALTKRSPA
jgi:hypothetical protein